MKNKKTLANYLIYLVVAFVFSLICATVWDLFSLTDPLAITKVVADSLFLPAVVWMSISLIGWIGSKGTFDIFSFSMHSLFSLLRRESYVKNESYYDYKQKKDENRKSFNLPMFSVGLLFLLLSLIATVIFFMLET